MFESHHQFPGRFKRIHFAMSRTRDIVVQGCVLLRERHEQVAIDVLYVEARIALRQKSVSESAGCERNRPEIGVVSLYLLARKFVA